DELVLTLEETVAADPTRGPALGRVLREGGDLDRAGLRARQRAARAGDVDHDRAVGVERRERDHPGARAELHARDAAAGTPLWPYAARGEVEQLSLAGDEAEGLVTGAQLDSADHLVVFLERDHVPVVAG